MIWYIIKSIIKVFYTPIKLSVHKYRWETKNRHNKTYPVSLFPIDKVEVGNYTYGPLEVHSWNHEDEKLKIGHFCSIAEGVKFLLGGNHETCYLSTYPFRFYFENKDEAFTKGKVVIEDDVWIGMDSVLLSGITIGRGCVIAASSVVTKSFPPYSIIGGNPAKMLKPRFDEDKIQKLMTIDFGKMDSRFIRENLAELYSEADFSGIIEKLNCK